MNDILLFSGLIVTGASLVITGMTWNYDIREPIKITPYISSFFIIVGIVMMTWGYCLK